MRSLSTNVLGSVAFSHKLRSMKFVLRLVNFQPRIASSFSYVGKYETLQLRICMTSFTLSLSKTMHTYSHWVRCSLGYLLSKFTRLPRLEIAFSHPPTTEDCVFLSTYKEYLYPIVTFGAITGHNALCHWSCGSNSIAERFAKLQFTHNKTDIFRKQSRILPRTGQPRAAS